MEENYELKRAIILFGVLLNAMKDQGLDTSVTKEEEKQYQKLALEVWGISSGITPDIEIELTQTTFDVLNELKSQVFSPGR